MVEKRPSVQPGPDGRFPWDPPKKTKEEVAREAAPVLAEILRKYGSKAKPKGDAA